MLSECIYTASGGGGITLANLLYNASKTLLGSITTYNGSYTTTEDCVMYGYGKSSSGSAPYIKAGDDFILIGNGSAMEWYIGYSSSSLATPDGYGIFVPKGTTITTRNVSNNTYNIRFYSLD